MPSGRTFALGIVSAVFRETHGPFNAESIMTVKTAQLPADSALMALRTPGDFLDCYSTENGRKGLTVSSAISLAFTNNAPWIRGLMAIRTMLVAPFGLKTGDAYKVLPVVEGESLVGKKVSIFTVFSHEEDEIIIGEDDKHLDFRISLSHKAGIWYIATWVKPHNIGGHIYLRAILPFHKLISRLSVAKLEAE